MKLRIMRETPHQPLRARTAPLISCVAQPGGSDVTKRRMAFCSLRPGPVLVGAGRGETEARRGRAGGAPSAAFQVEGLQSPIHRPGRHGRPGLGHRVRPGKPVRLLPRVRDGRRREDVEQRRHVPGRLRQGARGLDRRGRRRAVRPEDGVGRKRRGQRPQQLGLGRRRLPLDRRRRNVGQRGPQGLEGDRPHRRRPEGSENRLGRGGGEPLGAGRRPRPLRDTRRRQDLARRSAGAGAVRRSRRLRRGRPRPVGPEHDLRRPLRAPAPALVVHFRPGGDRRQGPRRHLQVDRRRRDLEEARKGPARRGPPASASPSRRASRASSTRSCSRTKPARTTSTRSGAGAAASSAPTTAARRGRARAR